MQEETRTDFSYEGLSRSAESPMARVARGVSTANEEPKPSPTEPSVKEEN